MSLFIKITWNYQINFTYYQKCTKANIVPEPDRQTTQMKNLQS